MGPSTPFCLCVISLFFLVPFSSGQEDDNDICANPVENQGHMMIQIYSPLVTSKMTAVDLKITRCNNDVFTVLLLEKTTSASGENCDPNLNYTVVWTKEIAAVDDFRPGQIYQYEMAPFELNSNHRVAILTSTSEYTVPFESVETGVEQSIYALAIDQECRFYTTYAADDTLCAFQLHGDSAKAFDRHVLFCGSDGVCTNDYDADGVVLVGPPGPQGPPGPPGPPGVAGEPGECCNNLNTDCGFYFDDLSLQETLNELTAANREITEKLNDLENSVGGNVLITGRCPTDEWIPGSYGIGYCYLLLPQEGVGSYAVNLMKCTEKGGFLVDILSELENDFLASKISETFPDNGKEYQESYTTSAMYAFENGAGEWLWRVYSQEQLRIPMSYENWERNNGVSQNEPVSSYDEQNCAVITVRRDADLPDGTSGGVSSYWEVVHCKSKNFLVCKVEKDCY